MAVGAGAYGEREAGFPRRAVSRNSTDGSILVTPNINGDYFMSCVFVLIITNALNEKQMCHRRGFNIIMEGFSKMVVYLK